MPRYFLNVTNGNGLTRDEEGIDLSDQASALKMAKDSTRSIVAEEALKGSLDLGGHVDVLDSSAALLEQVSFAGAFTLRLPAAAAE